MKGGWGSFLIGIKTNRTEWEMAVNRINSPLGEPIKIESVVPEMMFQDDSSTSNLEDTTTFIRLELWVTSQRREYTYLIDQATDRSSSSKDYINGGTVILATPSRIGFFSYSLYRRNRFQVQL